MSMIGTRVNRKEDPAFLTVGGKYVDDLAPSDALHAVFVRSLLAHADLIEVDTSNAATAPGVVAVFTAADLGFQAIPPEMPMLNQKMLRSALAIDRVRYVGEPIAVVLAESRETAVDAAELIYVDYEPLEPIMDPREAAKDHALLFPEAGTNTVFSLPSSGEELFADCEVVVDLEMLNPRLSVAPLEPRAGLASYSTETGRLTYWACTQFPHRTRDGLVGATGLAADQVHVITPDVGGGFGGKNANYPEDFAIAKASVQLGRPVRWTETRSESMVGIAHARALSYTVQIGGSRDGDITSYKCEVLQEGGAYPAIGSVLPMFVKIMATGVYDIPNVDVFANSVVTTTAPIGAYRGAGRPEATLVLERAVDAFATEIGMDPVEVRRRNFISPESFPFQTPTGADMDTGEYAAALDAVMAAADYDGLRAEQVRRLADSSASLLGIGWSAYVEIANPMGASEFGSVEVRPDGSALVLTGSSNHGQGHHTAFAQIAADVTGIPFDEIEVRHGDTDEVKRGGGTGGSRSLQVGGVAVNEAAIAVVEMAKDAAADMLEAARADIVLDIDSGTFAVTGTPATSLTWAEIVAHTHTGDNTGGLMAETDFQPPAATFPFGVHLSVVEIDRETGQVTPTRHVCCDDAGNIVNPTIVDGQVHGGVASGIAQALMEEFIYDEDGNPQTGNFMDYGFVSAAELPSFERLEMQTPTDRNPLGVKGVGEAGTIGATPAVQNAVVDALAHLGVRHVEIPCTAERVWRHLNGA
ncbi:MAG: xanthine dehydrogenase family protein molybdopterin-binding subunit [Acidimicrobiales bacterium]|nr:xanthine dehydrogenase family protein molybdopterin-binding subunit [Acidimicrobiales bacterium]